MEVYIYEEDKPIVGMYPEMHEIKEVSVYVYRP